MMLGREAPGAGKEARSARSRATGKDLIVRMSNRQPSGSCEVIILGRESGPYPVRAGTESCPQAFLSMYVLYAMDAHSHFWLVASACSSVDGTNTA